MKLEDLSRATAGLDVARFQEQYPHPALIFLTSIVRPGRDIRATLNEATLTDTDGAPDPSNLAIDEASLVLFLKPRFKPEAGVTLGRGLGNDYALPQPSVSKSHATFSLSESTWTIRDLGSSTGTFVNGRAVPSGGTARLASGALVGLGPDTIARFLVPSALHRLLTTYRALSIPKEEG